MTERNDILDLRGLKCPHVAVATKRAVLTKVKGDVLTVLCTDPLAALDIPVLAEQLGHHAAVGTEFEGYFTVTVTIREGVSNPDDIWPCTG
jgi:tRNA 2-thiouridine synthesizing protein A